MADIVKANFGFDATSLMGAINLGGLGLTAGEAIAKGDAMYIEPDDGLVYKAVSSELNAFGVSMFCGLAPQAYAEGDKVTPIEDGAIAEYAAGMTPGTYLFVSDTAGKLADADTSGLTDKPVAKVITATHILIVAEPRWTAETGS